MQKGARKLTHPPAKISLLALGNKLSQLLASFKLRNALGSNLDGLLGLGINPCACFASRSAESPKTNECNFLTLAHSIRNGIETCRQRLASLLFTNLCALCDRID